VHHCNASSSFFVKWNFTPVSRYQPKPRYNLKRAQGLMPPKFTGQRPMEGMGPRMITIVTAQVASRRSNFETVFRL
jgi:hypothetical protein